MQSYTTLWKNTIWAIYEGLAGSVWIANEKYGWSDNPVMYDSGKCAFDYPERIPLYVKRKWQKIMKDKRTNHARGN